MSAQGTNEGNQARSSKPRFQDTRRKYEQGEGGKGRQDRHRSSKPKFDNSSKPKYAGGSGPRHDGNRPQGSGKDRMGAGYQPGFMKDKDEDETDNSRRSKPMRPKENRQQSIQPDKTRTQLRFEKEQKTVKKKQAGTKKKESQRPQVKVKRSNNINYTKSYMNGDYDDYEYYEEF